MDLVHLRHGQTPHVDAAPQMGMGCSQGCCSLDGGFLHAAVPPWMGVASHRAAAPVMVVGCLRAAPLGWGQAGCCSSDMCGLFLAECGLHGAAAPWMWDVCLCSCSSSDCGGLLGWLLFLEWGQAAHGADAPRVGVGCLHSCCSLVRVGLHMAASPQLWAGCLCSCCSLGKGMLLLGPWWTAHTVATPLMGAGY